MRNLLLTLGHNSSAIMVDNGQILWGYETERITGLKSDSRFPINHIDPKEVDAVYVTHWAPTGNVADMAVKYWDPSKIVNKPIITHTPDLTHHDTHMAGALCYAGYGFPNDDSYGLVIDGFGSYGEHISIYKINGQKSTLIKRCHGYDTSLGLWYQYATAFMGMKMHEDEYKLLGYEVLVNSSDYDKISIDSEVYVNQWIDDLNASVYGSKYDPLYDLEALSNVKQKIYNHLLWVCNKYHISDPTSKDARPILACYVQMVLEKVVIAIVCAYRMKNVVLSGGVFYNVKLNKLILDHVLGQVCVYPLAGDQGNAIGLYAYHNPQFIFPEHLNWGVRKLHDVGEVKNLHVVDEAAGINLALDKLKSTGYVNVVRGNMEFGPRAMCNTSTLASPTRDVVDKINFANDRNTVMPMAPVMTRAKYNDMFYNTTRLHQSEEHMVCALEYKTMPSEALSGIAHRYNNPRLHYTGRPQVIRYNDTFMNVVLKFWGAPLINTSFNYHGKPIAYDMKSVIDNHMLQLQRDPNITTVVIKND